MMEMTDLNNQDREVINEKKNDYVKINFTPNRDIDYKFSIFDPNIWQGFPLRERFWYNLCCKSASYFKNDKLLNSEEVLSNPCRVDSKIKLADHCVGLTIFKSGTLDIEPRIIHPFVKVSIINLKTSKYLQKNNFEMPVFLLKEKNLIINHNSTQNILEFSESSLDFIPPFSTAPYDLRAKGESFAEWNEEFIINDDALNIFGSNNVLFFELMDFNLYSKESEFLYPIAWGYLKPVGYSQTYLGKFKIQLYKYKYKPTENMKEMRKINPSFLRTPDVLYEFNWIKKEKYQTFLEIELRAEVRPRIEEIKSVLSQKRFKYSVFKLEGEDINIELLKKRSEKEKFLKFDEFDQIGKLKRKVLLRRKRGSNEESIMPDGLLYKFSTAKLGCLTHEFSHNGKYLAAACTDINSMTTIKIFNIEDGNIKYHFKGHQDLIHSFVWSPDDLILISASSDNFVSFWNIPAEDSNNIENLEYMDNELHFKLLSISHPSYVYSISTFLEFNKETLVIATGCFDGVVRLFSINFNFDESRRKYTYLNHSLLHQILIFEEMQNIDFSQKSKNKTDNKLINDMKNNEEKTVLLEKTVLDHRHPNSLVFDEFGRLLIGDSLGSIHIWEVNLVSAKPLINKLKIISHKELEGDCINKIIIEPSPKKRLIIHSRDNCIRLLDISKDKPKVIVRLFGLKSTRTNVKSSVSPDSQFIVSGSEDGQPYLWSLQSGISLSNENFQCQFYDLLSDVSWNKEYNIVALSGFGQEYPLLVYVHEKKEFNLDPSDLKLKNINLLEIDNQEENNRNNNTNNLY